MESKTKNGHKPYEEYLEHWVSIQPGGGDNSASGKLVELVGCYAYLLPYHGGEYTEKGYVHGVKTEGLRLQIDLTPGTKVYPSTQKSVENACKYLNSQNGDAPKDSTKSDN